MKISHILLIFSFIFFIGTVQATTLNFTPPTEPNGTAISRNWTEVNITIDESNLDAFKFNWNSTNYTFYDDSLVLALNFNNNSAIGENDTKAVDISKYGNNGTIHGAVWTAKGRFGPGMYFDGSDDYVDCGNDESLNITDAITIEAWVKPAVDISGSGTRVFLEKMDAYGLVYGFLEGHLEVYLGGSRPIEYPVTLYKNKWYHLVGVWEGSTTGNVYLYINGENVANGNYTGSITSDHALQIGGGEAWSDAWRYFNGIIDEVRIYNRALSPDEIRMHYLSEFQKYNSTQYRFYNNITELAEGTYTYYGWANDTAGNTGSTETRTLTVDTTPPAITITYPTSNSVKNNYIINGTSTDANLNYTNISIKQGATIINSTTTTSSSWEVSLYVPDGVYNITATAYDNAGNSNSTTVTNVTIDTTPPTTTATAVKDDGSSYTFGTWTNSSYINVTLSCSDSVGCDTIQYCTDTDNTCNPNITYSSPVQITTEGTSYIRFRSNDTAGNLETTKSETIKIDTILPAITINSPSSKTYYSTTLQLITTISDPNLDTCWYSLNNINTTFNCTYTTFTASSGSNTITVYANDTAGNIGNASVTFTCTTPPAGGGPAYVPIKQPSAMKLIVSPELLSVNRSVQKNITLIWDGDPALCKINVSPEIREYIILPELNHFVTELPEVLIESRETTIPVKIKAIKPAQGTITFIIETLYETTSTKIPVIIEPAPVNLTSSPAPTTTISKPVFLGLILLIGLIAYLIWPEER